MKKIKSILILTVLLLLSKANFAQCGDVIVALDGSGDFTSVQAAVDAAPSDLTAPFVIYIKNGVYDEKIFITKNFITLVGEDRDRTILTTAVLRRVWRENNPSDWGVATINIQNGVTDLTIANMTVRNNFAEVFPDFPNNNDHTMAIRGGGHRVIIINCNIIATGGDTLSLWNTGGGMFYHNNCFFEGYVDYVAPRGYCYITDSKFFGYNNNASIWHDGSGGKDHKLVIRNSHFDGVTNFALGRYHRDAQFYLLDCNFSNTIRNQKIQFVGSEPLQYGERVYFDNTHREGFDFNWHRDNLWEAAGSPEPEEVTAQWTFNNEWDPESQLDGLLPFAFLPYPANQTCSDLNPSLTWAAGNCARSHNVYFGTSENPEFVGNQSETNIQPGELEENTTYFWRVDEVMENDTIRGQVWQFRTAKITDPNPNPAFRPNPPDNADFLTGNLVRLEWEFDKCSVDSFLVYFGRSPEELAFEGTQRNNFFFPFSTKDDSTYYWRVDTQNEHGITPGEVWRFTRNPSMTTSTHQLPDAAFELRQNFPNPFRDTTLIEYRIPAQGHVRIGIYDAQGRLLQMLVDGQQAAGTHQQTFAWSDLAHADAVLLLCKMQFGNATKTIKLLKK